MRVAAVRQGFLAIEVFPEAVLLPGQVRVRVKFCGICGSDLHWRTHFPDGTVMGHEITGSVEEVGPAVTDWKRGDRVGVMPVQHCGNCLACRSGFENICADRPFGVGGPGRFGGYAESVVVLASMLVALPDHLPDQAAALVEPLAVGLHGVGMADADPARPAAVIGAGTIGLVTVLALQARGFKNIAVVELDQARREVAGRLGVKTCEGKAEAVRAVLGELPAVIFECAGGPAPVAIAIEMIAPRGTIMLMSAPPEPIVFSQWEVMLKEAVLRTAIMYSRAEFEEAVALLATGKVRSDAVPVTIFPLNEAPRALTELLMRGTPHIKVLLTP